MMIPKNAYEGFIVVNDKELFSIISNANSIEEFKINALEQINFYNNEHNTNLTIHNLKNIYQCKIHYNKVMAGFSANIPMKQQKIPYDFKPFNNNNERK